MAATGGEDEEQLLGIRVGSFLECCISLGLRVDMVGPEVQATVKALTAEKGISALQYIKRADDAKLGPLAQHVQFPTIFLSHSWKYQLRDIVDALTSCKEDEVVWFDLLSVAQNGSSTRPFSWWRDKFAENVKKIGKLVLVMKPFGHSVTLTRAWCIFELFACVSTNSKFAVAMPADVKAAFLGSIKEDHRVFFKSISGIRTADCEASDPEDLRRISMVVQERGGFGKIDQLVIGKLKEWFVAVLMQQIEASGDDVERAAYMHALGAILKEDAKYKEGEKHLAEALAIRQRVLGAKKRETLWTMGWLGELYAMWGKIPQAEKLLVECWAAQKKELGERDEHTLRSMSNLGTLRGFFQGRLREGGAMLAECVRMAAEALGTGHELTMSVQYCLALVYAEDGKLREAQALYEECLERRREVLGLSHPDVLGTMHSLALVYGKAGRAEEARRMYEECLEREQAVLGVAHHDTLATMNNLALFYDNHRQKSRAEAMYQRCFEEMKAVLGVDHPDTLSTMYLLGSVRCDLNEWEDGEQLLRECVAKMTLVSHRDAAKAKSELLRAQAAQGRGGAAR